MSDNVWVGMYEFASCYGRTPEWARLNASQANFADFNIPTLRVLHSYGRRSRWFFLIPRALMSSVPNPSLPSLSQKP